MAEILAGQAAGTDGQGRNVITFAYYDDEKFFRYIEWMRRRVRETGPR